MERASRDVAGVPRARTPEEPAPSPVEETPEETPTEGPAKESTVDDGLTERQRAILDFERQWWKHAGAKEQAIRESFDLSPTRYYQLLNALLDDPVALTYDAVTVRRLRRVRATRSRARGGAPR